MPDQTCCFSGHKRLPAELTPEIERLVNDAIGALISRGVHNYCGGANLGFDNLVALSLLKLKARFNFLKLDLVLGIKNQTEGWDMKEEEIYQRILAGADSITYIAQQYREGVMQERSRTMVDMSQICLCYVTKTSGGAAYTHAYAREKGLEIINIADQLTVNP